MLQEFLSEESSIGNEWLTTPCSCVTCDHKMQVVMRTQVFTLLGEVFDFKKPHKGEFVCSNCGSHYIRWEQLQIIQ